MDDKTSVKDARSSIMNAGHTNTLLHVLELLDDLAAGSMLLLLLFHNKSKFRKICQSSSRSYGEGQHSAPQFGDRISLIDS